MDTFDDIVDRKGWPSGEWDHEPDRAVWVHDATGARCTLRRGPLGSWCGYVGVRGNHPVAGKDYNDIDVYVHGGLTYGHYCQPMAEDEWIRYRLFLEKWLTESLLFPLGDAARHVREDRRGNTATLAGYREWMGNHVLCHADCPHGLWWVGFDTAHGGDIVPGMIAARRSLNLPEHPSPWVETYKNFQWMVEETNRLAVELFEEKLLTDHGGKE